MYWNNPVIEITYPSHIDPIHQSLHNGNHCLFYNSEVDITQIHNSQNLQEFCNQINCAVSESGWENFFADAKNHDNIANLVKINLWVRDFPKTGNIKPMLLTYTGGKFNSDFASGTGSSRLRALELLPNIKTVSAFITTSSEFKNEFHNLEMITTLDRFAELCNAKSGQKFLFRLTDPNAPFGLDWYEYDSDITKSVTPGNEACVQALKNYIDQNTNIFFNPLWFESNIQWKFQ
jgi:hypothetical protein